MRARSWSMRARVAASGPRGAGVTAGRAAGAGAVRAGVGAGCGLVAAATAGGAVGGGVLTATCFLAHAAPIRETAATAAIHPLRECCILICPSNYHSYS